MCDREKLMQEITMGIQLRPTKTNDRSTPFIRPEDCARLAKVTADPPLSPPVPLEPFEAPLPPSFDLSAPPNPNPPPVKRTGRQWKPPPQTVSFSRDQLLAEIRCGAALRRVSDSSKGDDNDAERNDCPEIGHCLQSPVIAQNSDAIAPTTATDSNSQSLVQSDNLCEKDLQQREEDIPDTETSNEVPPLHAADGTICLAQRIPDAPPPPPAQFGLFKIPQRSQKATSEEGYLSHCPGVRAGFPAGADRSAVNHDAQYGSSVTTPSATSDEHPSVNYCDTGLENILEPDFSAPCAAENPYVKEIEEISLFSAVKSAKSVFERTSTNSEPDQCGETPTCTRPTPRQSSSEQMCSSVPSVSALARCFSNNSPRPSSPNRVDHMESRCSIDGFRNVKARFEISNGTVQKCGSQSSLRSRRSSGCSEGSNVSSGSSQASQIVAKCIDPGTDIINSNNDPVERSDGSSLSSWSEYDSIDSALSKPSSIASRKIIFEQSGSEAPPNSSSRLVANASQSNERVSRIKDHLLIDVVKKDEPHPGTQSLIDIFGNVTSKTNTSTLKRIFEHSDRKQKQCSQQDDAKETETSRVSVGKIMSPFLEMDGAVLPTGAPANTKPPLSDDKKSQYSSDAKESARTFLTKKLTKAMIEEDLNSLCINSSTSSTHDSRSLTETKQRTNHPAHVDVAPSTGTIKTVSNDRAKGSSSAPGLKSSGVIREIDIVVGAHQGHCPNAPLLPYEGKADHASPSVSKQTSLQCQIYGTAYSDMTSNCQNGYHHIEASSDETILLTGTIAEFQSVERQEIHYHNGNPDVRKNIQYNNDLRQTVTFSTGLNDTNNNNTPVKLVSREA